jgi:hypothetical protein
MVFGDPISATAVLNRLLYHSSIVNIRGERYRLKDRGKAGLLWRPERKEESRLAGGWGIPNRRYGEFWNGVDTVMRGAARAGLLAQEPIPRWPAAPVLAIR